MIRKGLRGVDKRILELLDTLGFNEHPEKPLLFRKQVDDITTAYVDFRKAQNGSLKGRRFAMRADYFLDNPDEIQVLKQFKVERDEILTSEREDARSEFIPADKLRSRSFDFIKNIVGSDLLEVFGDTGSGKSKFVHALAMDALGTSKKVFFLDTERNLNNADIARLDGAYQYTPVFEEIKKITQHLPAVDLVIIDSVGLPILTKFARMTMQEKGNALLDLIALMGDLKEWAYRHNAMAVVTNQPESEFAKPEGYERKPFGDKSCFAAKEIWHVGTTRKDKNLTKSTMKAFRSRCMGKGTEILELEIRDETKIVLA